jgi:hypothetical protein
MNSVDVEGCVVEWRKAFQHPGYAALDGISRLNAIVRYVGKRSTPWLCTCASRWQNQDTRASELPVRPADKLQIRAMMSLRTQSAKRRSPPDSDWPRSTNATCGVVLFRLLSGMGHSHFSRNCDPT